MAGHAKKSTRKFEKSKLKGVLERRKEAKKVKQKHLAKEKQKARKEEDRQAAASRAKEAKKRSGRNGAKGKELREMTVDEFFQGGFEIENETQKNSTGKKGSKDTKANKAKATGKRKRGDEDAARTEEYDSSSSFGGEENPVLSDSAESSGAEDDGEAHKQELGALAEKDPEFYKYLQENEPELLDFDDGDRIAELDQDGGSEEPPPKKSKKKERDSQRNEHGQLDASISLIEKWKVAMAEKHSLRASREIVLAFRAACHLNEEEDKKYKYTISSAEAYQRLIAVTLEHIPSVLAHHLPVKENANGRVRVPSSSSKYKTLSPLLNTHALALTHLLEDLSDEPTMKLTLARISPLLPYFLSFKKAVRNLTRAVVAIWSDSSKSEAARINAFMIIRRLVVITDPSLREAVLKTTYQGLVKGCRNTTIHTIAGINLMKNSAAGLWGVDTTLGYTTGFNFIRQLAIHLRSSIAKPTKDSYKVIYNWQFIHSLDFWSRVLSAHCSPSSNPMLKKPSDCPLHPLIYPVVQISLGTLRLVPTPAYFPLRFHLTRSMLRISSSTNTYIPLATHLIEVLQSPEMKKAPKPSTLKPLDFATTLRVPKSYLHTRVYQDSAGEQLMELMAEFFGVWAKNIAFPELVIPPTVFMKRWLKEVSTQQKAPPPSSSSSNGKKKKGKGAIGGNRNNRLNSAVSLLVHKLNANAAFVEQERRTVDFAPYNRSAVEAFLRDYPWEDTPLGAYVDGIRKKRAEREKILEQSRKEEQERGRADRGSDDDQGVEEADEWEEEEEEEEEEEKEEGDVGRSSEDDGDELSMEGDMDVDEAEDDSEESD